MAAAAGAAGAVQADDNEELWFPDILCDEFLDFAPYAARNEIPGDGKKDPKGVSNYFRNREFLRECGAVLLVTPKDQNSWRAAKAKDKSAAKDLVKKFTRHIVMKVMSGEPVIKATDLREFIKLSPLDGAPMMAILTEASKQLKEIWGYEVCPSVQVETDDTGHSFKSSAAEFIVRMDAGLYGLGRLAVKEGSAAAGHVDAARDSFQQHMIYLSSYSSREEKERRGILTAILSAMASKSVQLLGEGEIFSLLAATGDPAFIEQDRKRQDDAQGANKGAGSKRGRDADSSVTCPGGLPLKDLLSEFVEQRWLKKEKRKASEVGQEAAGAAADNVGAGGVEQDVEVYVAGPRARLTIGPLGTIRIVKALTNDPDPLVRDRVAVHMPGELGPFQYRVPARTYDVAGAQGEDDA